MDTRAFRIVAGRYSLVLLIAMLAAGTVACRKPKDPENPAQVKKNLDKIAKLVTWKVDATEAQKARVDRILTDLSVGMFTVQKGNDTITKRIMDTLDATRVDAAQFESIVQDSMVLVERQIRQIFKAVVDITGVLTDEQRHKAVKMWREWEFGS